LEIVFFKNKISPAEKIARPIPISKIFQELKAPDNLLPMLAVSRLLFSVCPSGDVVVFCPEVFVVDALAKTILVFPGVKVELHCHPEEAKLYDWPLGAFW